MFGRKTEASPKPDWQFVCGDTAQKPAKACDFDGGGAPRFSPGTPKSNTRRSLGTGMISAFDAKAVPVRKTITQINFFGVISTHCGAYAGAQHLAPDSELVKWT